MSKGQSQRPIAAGIAGIACDHLPCRELRQVPIVDLPSDLGNALELERGETPLVGTGKRFQLFLYLLHQSISLSSVVTTQHYFRPEFQGIGEAVRSAGRCGLNSLLGQSELTVRLGSLSQR